MNDAEFIAAMQRGLPPIAPPTDPTQAGAEDIGAQDPQRVPAQGGR